MLIKIIYEMSLKSTLIYPHLSQNSLNSCSLSKTSLGFVCLKKLD